MKLFGATNVSGPLLQQAIDRSGNPLPLASGPMPVAGYALGEWFGHNSNTEILVELWWR
jgi:hypothetical protein